jgi:hypothetical protein
LKVEEDKENKEEQEVSHVDYETIPPMFVQANTLPASTVDLNWNEPDEEGLKKFLETEMGFNEDRVDNVLRNSRLLSKLKLNGGWTVSSALWPLLLTKHQRNERRMHSNYKTRKIRRRRRRELEVSVKGNSPYFILIIFVLRGRFLGRVSLLSNYDNFVT